MGVSQFRALVDITLALMLFLDAANARTSVLKGYWGLPARMLGIGLPMAILLGTGLAWLMFDDFSIYEAAVLGTMLAATDAALGKAVADGVQDFTLEIGVVGESLAGDVDDGRCVVGTEVAGDDADERFEDLGVVVGDCVEVGEEEAGGCRGL